MTPWDRVFSTKRRFEHRPVVCCRRVSAADHLFESQGISRAEDRPDIVSRPDIVQQNPYRMPGDAGQKCRIWAGDFFVTKLPHVGCSGFHGIRTGRTLEGRQQPDNLVKHPMKSGDLPLEPPILYFL